jgi:hypothetical protein
MAAAPSTKLLWAWSLDGRPSEVVVVVKLFDMPEQRFDGFCHSQH